MTGAGRVEGVEKEEREEKQDTQEKQEKVGGGDDVAINVSADVGMKDVKVNGERNNDNEDAIGVTKEPSSNHQEGDENNHEGVNQQPVENGLSNVAEADEEDEEDEEDEVVELESTDTSDHEPLVVPTSTTRKRTRAQTISIRKPRRKRLRRSATHEDTSESGEGSGNDEDAHSLKTRSPRKSLSQRRASDTDSSSEAAGNDWEAEVGSDSDEDVDEDELIQRTCIVCGQDEEHDPGEDFEEILACHVCDDRCHRQCAREQGYFDDEDDAAEEWRCPPCLSSNVRPGVARTATPRKQSQSPPRSQLQLELQSQASQLSPSKAGTTTAATTTATRPRSNRSTNIARDLLPANYASQPPNSHSIFNTLIIDGDSVDGSRSLRRRRQEQQQAVEEKNENDEPSLLSATSPPSSARKAFGLGGYDGATTSPYSYKTGGVKNKGKKGKGKKQDKSLEKDREPSPMDNIPELLGLTKPGKGNRKKGVGAMKEKNAAAATAGERVGRKSERRIQQQQAAREQAKCTVLKRTATSYILTMHLPKPKLRHLLRTSSRLSLNSSTRISFKRKLTTDPDQTPSSLPVSGATTLPAASEGGFAMPPPPLHRDLTRFPKSSPFTAPFYSFPTRTNDELKSKPYGGILSADDAETTRTLPLSADRERFERARTKAESEWRQKMEAAEQAGEVSRTADEKVSGPPSKIKCVNFGGWEIETWYAAPYPEEYSRNRVLYICEFCLKYMNSAFVAWRHKLKCPAKHPPGDEIYRDGSVSISEVDGRKNPVYCQNLCLLAKLFLGSKTLYYDVEPFLFYVMTECDELGCHFVGYFSKEKRVGSSNNVSCILTLPIHQRKGYGNLLIDFSYLLTRVERKTGSPEKPLSDMGLVSYRNYWRLVLSYTLRDEGKKPVSISDLSVKTGMTPDDIVSGLEGLRALVRDPVTKKYALRIDYDYLNEYIANWEKKGYVKLNPDALVWTPYLTGRNNQNSSCCGTAHPHLDGYDCAPHSPTSPPAISTVAPREDKKTADVVNGQVSHTAGSSAVNASGDGSVNSIEMTTTLQIPGEGQGDPNEPFPPAPIPMPSPLTLSSEETPSGYSLPAPEPEGGAMSVNSSIEGMAGAEANVASSIASSSFLRSHNPHNCHHPHHHHHEEAGEEEQVNPAEGIPPTRFEIYPPPFRSGGMGRKRGRPMGMRGRGGYRRGAGRKAETGSSASVGISTAAASTNSTETPRRKNPLRAAAAAANAGNPLSSSSWTPGSTTSSGLVGFVGGRRITRSRLAESEALSNGGESVKEEVKQEVIDLDAEGEPDPAVEVVNLEGDKGEDNGKGEGVGTKTNTETGTGTGTGAVKGTEIEGNVDANVDIDVDVDIDAEGEIDPEVMMEEAKDHDNSQEATAAAAPASATKDAVPPSPHPRRNLRRNR